MADSSVYYNSTNGHYYKWVSQGGITWQQAKTLAEGSVLNGTTGYLATVTTAQEMSFIDSTVFASGRPDNTYIGGSDALEEGVWRWVTGPEGDLNNGTGTIFFNAGTYVGEKAADWQPNSGGYTSGGDYLYLYSWWEAKFNPSNNSLGSPSSGGPQGYLVEWGGPSIQVEGEYEFVAFELSDGTTKIATGSRDSSGLWVYQWQDHVPLTSSVLNAYTFEHTSQVISATSSFNQRLQLVKDEFGNSANIAEFNDLKDLSLIIDADDLVDYLDLKEVNLDNIPNYTEELPYANEGPFVTYNGQISHSGLTSDRQYFISAHDGLVPSGWLAFDEIDGNIINLGSWYYDRQVLAKIDLTQSFTISNTSTNSSPTLSSKTLSLAENSVATTAVGALTATDPEGDSLTYSITAGNTDVDGDGKAAFAINTSTGAVTVNDAGDLNYEGTRTFSLTVSASDGSLSSNATATVNLTNVNEAP
ncbi:cadherin domain-containing protein, partial [Limnohabitans sp.]|uniref:cadherin domain-containing protein n=1 Tax=Limnohabitans sp. TaxID=1907725 RepID=UPI0039BD1654|nr:cadherin domain-containing protein [Comamonadaceae bacterium]